MFLILLMYLCIASAFTVGKTALEYADPMFLVGTRMCIAGLLLLGSLYLFNKNSFKFKKKDWWLFAQLAVVGVFLSYASEFWAMKHNVSSVKACLFFNLSPFFTAILAYFMINEKLSRRKWIGLAVGFLGMAPMLLTNVEAESVAGNFGIISIPEIAMLFSVITFAQSWIVFKQLMTRGYAPPMINGLTMLGGGVLSLISSFLVEGFPPVITATGSGPDATFYNFVASYVSVPYAALAIFALYIAYLILVTNVFAYNLYGYLMNSYSTTFLSFAGFTTPIFGGMLGWFFRGEQVTWHFWASVFLVFIGLYIFYKDELKTFK